MAFITVNISGLNESNAKLKKLAVSMHELQPAMIAIGKELERFFANDVFDSEGGALGNRWQPLKAATLSYKSQHYPGRLMLERTGNLRRSFYSEAEPLSVYISNKAKTSSGQSLFAIHQLGTSSGSGRGHNIPARPMMGINDPVKRIIASIIEREIRIKVDA